MLALLRWEHCHPSHASHAFWLHQQAMLSDWPPPSMFVLVLCLHNGEITNNSFASLIKHMAVKKKNAHQFIEKRR
jgi:hypothetical protein